MSMTTTKTTADVRVTFDILDRRSQNHIFIAEKFVEVKLALVSFYPEEEMEFTIL